MKIQIDIPPALNKKLKMEKTRRDFKTLQETAIKLLAESLK